ncbi:MAG TPA: phosphoribosylglycinamide formyltransferase [Dissulfurispiraceae bacterium]|nr:phosphoribosylglycinamide formyltransferase [Dissulfurispiraceae bacterium]
MLRLGILASGRGSNFQSIIDAIENGRLNAQVTVLIVDKPNAFARERARKHGIEDLYLNPQESLSKDAFFERIRDELTARHVDLVILAGFMRIVRSPLIAAFQNRIMNIHPALLPSFSGLHGQKQAVDYGVRVSGCTVHFVDEGMDTGPIIIQAAVSVSPSDSEESLSSRILVEEHRIYPEAIRLYAEGRLTVDGRIVKISGYDMPESVLVNPPPGC